MVYMNITTGKTMFSFGLPTGDKGQFTGVENNLAFNSPVGGVFQF